ncbi:MAG TPA: SMC-Scp complex subunit ScpB [Pirellulales bacterium]|nr:SMC-Scp complex subunit ScpB [Pirellulales bacterium]
MSWQHWHIQAAHRLSGRIKQKRLSGWPTVSSRGFVRLWQFRNAGEFTVLPPPQQGSLGREPRLARVEAVLFLAREPLSSRKIAQLANLADGNVARTLVRRLRRLYDASFTAFQVEEVAGGYQLFTRPRLAPWLRRLLQTSVETRLSAPALETLAVVAYRQPVLRVEIEAVRGVHCDEILRQLLERDLVRIVGRAEDLGRPLLYGTTKRFLELFGLRHVEELPWAAEFKAAVEKSNRQVDISTNDGIDCNPGIGRGDHKSTIDPTLEEKSVTTSIRPANIPADIIEEPLEAVSWAARRRSGNEPISAAKDENEEEDEDIDDEEEDEDDDEDWEDEEDDEEAEDDFVDEEWEEVDDDEEDDDEEDDDEEWEDDDEDDDDWEEDDDDDDDEEWEEEEK